MIARDLDRLVEQALVSVLADAVAARLLAHWRSALVLHGATALGQEAALCGLDTLAAEGWHLEHALSDGMRAPFATPLRSALARHRMRVTEPADPEVLLDDTSLVLVPTLTRTLAAKTALGLHDSFAAHLLGRALERGKTIIVATDGCCPDSRAWGDRLPAAQRAVMAGHLETLRSFGIRIAWAATLARTAQSARPLPISPAVQPHEPTEAPAPAGRVLGAAEASAWAGRTARIGAGTLVTPLAAEILRSRGIDLIRM